MPLNLTRRDVLKFVGGSIAGIMVTPVPWKLLDDIAIWTQNGPWIPKVPRGPITTAYSTCTLCPIGCGIKARCVNSIPYALTGIRNHPVNNGTLCPSGLVGHHLAYHPLRLKSPVRIARDGERVEVRPVPLEELFGTMKDAMIRSGAEGEFAILDQRPGRTISLFYQTQLKKYGHGTYLVPPTDPSLITLCLDEMTGTSYGPVGYDLAKVRTILSLSAPVLDGWCSPVQKGMMLTNHTSGRSGCRIIQVDSRYSRSAQLADQWIPLNPNTEAALAFGLAHVLVRDGLYNKSFLAGRALDFQTKGGYSYRDLVGRFTPNHTSEITGVSPDDIIAAAQALGKETPSLVIGDGDSGGGPLGREAEIAVWGLNILLDALTEHSVIVPRRPVPVQKDLEPGLRTLTRNIVSVPDRSIGFLLIDASEPGDPIPWSLLERKLIPDHSLVVALSPTLTGLARHADFVIPTPAHLESLADVPTTLSSPTATFSISSPLLKRPEEAMDAREIAGRIFGLPGTMEDILKQRAEAIFETHQGKLFMTSTGTSVPVREVGSVEEFWQGLSSGGVWVDEPVRVRRFPSFHFMGRSPDAFARMLKAGESAGVERSTDDPRTLTVLPYGRRAEASGAQLSPLMTKLYQESGLHRSSRTVVVNPATATTLKLKQGDTGVLVTERGHQEVSVRVDAAVMPGVAEIAVNPEPVGLAGTEILQEQSILELIVPDQAATWRAFRATLRKA